MNLPIKDIEERKSLNEITNTDHSHLKFRLPEIQSLNMLKMEKNFIALEKGYLRQPYKDDRQPTEFFINRLTEELVELIIAFKSKNIEHMKEELADMSNIIDYIFEQLLQAQGRINK